MNSTAMMRVLLLRLGFVLSLSLAFFSIAAVANAQPTLKVREELPEGLRDNWDAAGELFDDANFEAALIEYQRIYKESSNPRVLYNIGVCWKERKFYSQAVAAWEKQLQSKDRLPKAEVDRATTAIEAVKPFVTTLELTTNQTDAKLFIKDTEVGKTPFPAAITIDVGPNKLVLEKVGFARVERMIEVVKGQPAKVTLNMVPAEKTATARIAVTGAEGASIFIDGTDMGPAPFDGEVPTGRHTFEARLKGFLPAQQTSEVVFGEPLRITLSLTGELNEGKVKIRTGHTDAVIKIDGTVKGSGTWEGLLTAGGHRVEITKSGYKTRTEEIAVATDQERVVDLILVRDEGSSWIYWTVTGVLIAAGAATTCYFVLKPAEGSQVTGTLSPGVVETGLRAPNYGYSYRPLFSF